jgi:hypothetical protein
MSSVWLGHFWLLEVSTILSEEAMNRPGRAGSTFGLAHKFVRACRFHWPAIQLFVQENALDRYLATKILEGAEFSLRLGRDLSDEEAKAVNAIAQGNWFIARAVVPILFPYHSFKIRQVQTTEVESEDAVQSQALSMIARMVLHT